MKRRRRKRRRKKRSRRKRKITLVALLTKLVQWKEVMMPFRSQPQGEAWHFTHKI